MPTRATSVPREQQPVSTISSPCGQQQTGIHYDQPQGMFKEPAMFKDRESAGSALAERLVEHLAGCTTRRRSVSNIPIVVTLPRGGIPVGRVVAERLDADFDLCMVRRIPGPTSQHGASIAAVTEQGDILLSQPSSWGVSRKYIEVSRMKELEDIKQRRLLYASKPITMRRRVVIIVDDCIATGASMLAALHMIKKERPSRIIIASPFCSQEARCRIQSKCDDLVVLHYPSTFVACAQFYVSFPQVNDVEVLDCIRSQRDRILKRDRHIGEFDMMTRDARRESISRQSTSSSEDPEERKDEDDLDSFRVLRAQSWAATLLSSDDEVSSVLSRPASVVDVLEAADSSKLSISFTTAFDKHAISTKL